MYADYCSPMVVLKIVLLITMPVMVIVMGWCAPVIALFMVGLGPILLRMEVQQGT